MGKLILTRGVPASGKTTYAKEWVAEAPKNRARVNRDDLRMMMYGAYWGETVDERMVTAAQHALVTRLLGAHDVIVDDTNLRAKTVKDWYGISADIEFVDFPIGIDDAVERDIRRGIAGGRSVGADVVRSFVKRYTKGDGLILPPVPVNESKLVDPKPYVPGPTLAVSFDLDGTLAHMNGRSPFDPTLYHTDTVDEHVRDALWLYYEAGYTIIILTARDGAYRAEVTAWLLANNIPHDLLLMRAAGDTRNDAIVKSEIVDTYISERYDIRMHYDDRDRVVNALRDKGVKVAQVNPGNF